jgi:hypothetical protein
MKNQNSNNSELDLFDTSKAVYRIGVRILKTTYIFCFKKRWWIVVAIAVAALASVVKYRYDAAANYSVISLRSNTLPTGVAINFANNYLATVRKRKDLQNTLNLPDSVFDHINKIAAHWGIDVNGDGIIDKLGKNTVRITDTTQEVLIRNQFYICVNWQSKPNSWEQESQYLQQVTTAIIALFEQNKCIAEQNMVRVAQLEQQINEITIVDSLQKIKFGNTNAVRDVFDAQRIYQLEGSYRSTDMADMLKLIDQKLKIERELRLYAAPISFVGNVSQEAVQKETDLWKNMWIAMLAAVFVALLAAFVRDKHKSLVKQS